MQCIFDNSGYGSFLPSAEIWFPRCICGFQAGAPPAPPDDALICTLLPYRHQFQPLIQSHQSHVASMERILDTGLFDNFSPQRSSSLKCSAVNGHAVDAVTCSVLVPLVSFGPLRGIYVPNEWHTAAVGGAVWLLSASFGPLWGIFLPNEVHPCNVSVPTERLGYGIHGQSFLFGPLRGIYVPIDRSIIDTNVSSAPFGPLRGIYVPNEQSVTWRATGTRVVLFRSEYVVRYDGGTVLLILDYGEEITCLRRTGIDLSVDLDLEFLCTNQVRSDLCLAPFFFGMICFFALVLCGEDFSVNCTDSVNDAECNGKDRASVSQQTLKNYDEHGQHEILQRRDGAMIWSGTWKQVLVSCGLGQVSSLRNRAFSKDCVTSYGGPRPLSSPFRFSMYRFDPGPYCFMNSLVLANVFTRSVFTQMI